MNKVSCSSRTPVTKSLYYSNGCHYMRVTTFKANGAIFCSTVHSCSISVFNTGIWNSVHDDFIVNIPLMRNDDATQQEHTCKGA